MAMDFDKLYAEALRAWPAEVRLPVRSFVTGHLVDGLTDLEQSIAAQWKGGPLEVLMVTLNWSSAVTWRRSSVTKAAGLRMGSPIMAVTWSPTVDSTMQSTPRMRRRPS
jgi:hypothetical protein